jgi:nitrilase
MKVYVLQMCSSPNVSENLSFIKQQLNDTSADLTNAIVVLPECFAAFGASDSQNQEIAESLNEGEIQTQLSALASQYSMYLVAGTFPISDDANGLNKASNKVKPVTLVYSPQGDLIAHYQKIHLFDVDVEDGVGSYRESDNWIAGEQLVCFDTEFGRIGLAICYDLRFPGLFQALRDEGADVIILPSAFTEKTGAAHWQVLLQARAIENQVYMIGCDQAGTHKNGRQTFGHSMIVDPWGTVIFNAEKELGLFGTKLNYDNLTKVRQSMPIKKHNKFVSRNIKSSYQD